MPDEQISGAIHYRALMMGKNSKTAIGTTGNTLTTDTTGTTANLENITNGLSLQELKAMDENNDGVVTQAEFSTYVTQKAGLRNTGSTQTAYSSAMATWNTYLTVMDNIMDNGSNDATSRINNNGITAREDGSDGTTILHYGDDVSITVNDTTGQINSAEWDGVTYTDNNLKHSANGAAANVTTMYNSIRHKVEGVISYENNIAITKIDYNESNTDDVELPKSMNINGIECNLTLKSGETDVYQAKAVSGQESIDTSKVQAEVKVDKDGNITSITLMDNNDKPKQEVRLDKDGNPISIVEYKDGVADKIKSCKNAGIQDGHDLDLYGTDQTLVNGFNDDINEAVSDNGIRNLLSFLGGGINFSRTLGAGSTNQLIQDFKNDVRDNKITNVNTWVNNWFSTNSITNETLKQNVENALGKIAGSNTGRITKEKLGLAITTKLVADKAEKSEITDFDNIRKTLNDNRNNYFKLFEADGPLANTDQQNIIKLLRTIESQKDGIDKANNISGYNDNLQNNELAFLADMAVNGKTSNLITTEADEALINAADIEIENKLDDIVDIYATGTRPSGITPDDYTKFKNVLNNIFLNASDEFKLTPDMLRSVLTGQVKNSSGTWEAGNPVIRYDYGEPVYLYKDADHSKAIYDSGNNSAPFNYTYGSNEYNYFFNLISQIAGISDEGNSALVGSDEAVVELRDFSNAAIGATIMNHLKERSDNSYANLTSDGKKNFIKLVSNILNDSQYNTNVSSMRKEILKRMSESPDFNNFKIDDADLQGILNNAAKKRDKNVSNGISVSDHTLIGKSMFHDTKISVSSTGSVTVNGSAATIESRGVISVGAQNYIGTAEAGRAKVEEAKENLAINAFDDGVNNEQAKQNWRLLAGKAETDNTYDTDIKEVLNDIKEYLTSSNKSITVNGSGDFKQEPFKNYNGQKLEIAKALYNNLKGNNSSLQLRDIGTAVMALALQGGQKVDLTATTSPDGTKFGNLMAQLQNKSNISDANATVLIDAEKYGVAYVDTKSITNIWNEGQKASRGNYMGTDDQAVLGGQIFSYSAHESININKTKANERLIVAKRNLFGLTNMRILTKNSSLTQAQANKLAAFLVRKLSGGTELSLGNASTSGTFLYDLPSDINVADATNLFNNLKGANENLGLDDLGAAVTALALQGGGAMKSATTFSNLLKHLQTTTATDITEKSESTYTAGSIIKNSSDFGVGYRDDSIAAILMAAAETIDDTTGTQDTTFTTNDQTALGGSVIGLSSTETVGGVKDTSSSDSNSFDNLINTCDNYEKYRLASTTIRNRVQTMFNSYSTELQDKQHLERLITSNCV